MPKQLTVLEVLPALDSGGVEIGAVSLAQALIHAGHQALVVSSGGQMVKELQNMGAHHIVLPLRSKNPFVIFSNFRKLRKIITTYKVDIVHARSRAPAWSAYFACKKEGCIFITTIHGAYKAQNALKKFYNSIMLRSDHIIATSEFIARYITQTYEHMKALAPNRLHIIHRGIDCEVFNPQAVSQTRAKALALQWQLPRNIPLLILPARLAPSKGHSLLLEALASLPDENFLCLFIGSDQGRLHYSATLKQDIDRLGLQNKVRIVGYCQDMACAYKLADIVLNPSIVPEAFGRVIIEAQAMGKPVIATKLGAPIDLIAEGKTGWLVPVGDAQALASAIKDVLHMDEKTKRSLALAARQQVEAQYSNAQMCEKTLALYQRVLTRRISKCGKADEW